MPKDTCIADKWQSLPRGWTEESVNKFWDSLTGEAEHKVTKCIERMKDHVDDAGAFCGSLRDRIEGDTSWRSERRAVLNTPPNIPGRSGTWNLLVYDDTLYYKERWQFSIWGPDGRTTTGDVTTGGGTYPSANTAAQAGIGRLPVDLEKVWFIRAEYDWRLRQHNAVKEGWLVTKKKRPGAFDMVGYLRTAGFVSFGRYSGRAGEYFGLRDSTRAIVIGKRDVMLAVFKEPDRRWGMQDIEYQSKMTPEKFGTWIEWAKKGLTRKELRDYAAGHNLPYIDGGRVSRTASFGAGIHVDVRELPDAIRAVLREVGYGRRSIRVGTATEYTMAASSGKGYKAFTAGVNLLTGAYKIEYGSWGGPNMYNPRNQVDLDRTRRSIPMNGAVVQGHEGGGEPVYADVLVHPGNLQALLPAPADALSLTDEEEKALEIIRRYKPGYRNDGFIRAGLGWYRPVNPHVQSLAAKGLVKITGVGVSITLAGKNYRMRSGQQVYAANRVVRRWLLRGQ